MGRLLSGSRTIFLGLFVLVMLIPGAAMAQSQDDLPPTYRERDLLGQLGEAHIYRNDATNKVSLIGASKQDPIERPAGLLANASPEVAARAHLSKYGVLFGVRNQAQQLRTEEARAAGQGRSLVRFQQVHDNVPVLGGELNAQVTDANELLVANGEILPNISLDTDPGISAAEARETALAKIAKDRDERVADLDATDPELWIYNPELLGAPGPQVTMLVWRMDVTPVGLDLFNELVLVDAQTGAVVLNFDQLDNVRDRKTYTANNGTTIPGTLVCDETNPTCTGGDADAVAAHRYAGDTYDFYSTNHGRDSMDGSGMSMISTVHYGTNFQNAGWTGTQMVYGDGFPAADDVVGHELTHGVTDHESNLFYYYQSGAINESLSDVWGEFIDQTNGSGTDTAGVKWKLGEDVPGFGAIRDMSNPPLFNDPDRMTSTLYFADLSEQDRGGVHTNSGVNNKAAFLMTDGGTFNNKTVTGLGITKVAKIYYEVQTNLLTSASDYENLYAALQQACTNLTGTAGITAADCQEVKDAVDATEMNLQPTTAPAPEAPVCPSSPNVESTLFFDNLENPASGNWTRQPNDGTNFWFYPQNPNIPNANFDATYATSGTTNIWGYDKPSTGDYSIAKTTGVTVPSGTKTYLRFNHAYGFEDGFDGGVLEYSTNNGSTWTDAGSLIVDNGYSGTLSSGNPLGARQAFMRESNGYISSRVDLSSLAGQSVRFRFRIGTDFIVGDLGWFVDDVRVYTCAADTVPPAPPVITSPPNNTVDTDGNFTISGTAEANSTVELFEESSSRGTATVSGGGQWSKALTGVGDGSHTYTAKARDADGNVSDPSSPPLTVEVKVPPVVTNILPANQAQNVAVNTSVEATFSEAMNEESVENTDPTTGEPTTFTLEEQGSSTQVPATVDYNPATKKVTLTPNSNLASDITYTATIKGGSTGAKDLAGNALAQDHTWTFTAVIAPPTVVSYTPTETSGVPRNTQPTATFSTNMSASTLTPTTVKFQIYSKKKKKWVSVAHTIEYDAPSRTATVIPGTTTLGASKKYRVTVTTSVKSSSGFTLDQNPNTSGNQPKVWTFTTGTALEG